eukprot:545059_1
MLNLAHPKIMDFYAELGHHLQSRFLLSSETNGHEEYGEYDDTHIEETNGHDSTGCEDLHDDAHDIESAFQHIYFVMLFMACLWFVGKVFARCGLPSLVGEILCGIILGPNLLGFVPYSDALVVIGEVGLVLLVLEAGIDVSIGHLKVVGYRGLSVAVFGSMLPLGIGTGLGYAYGNELQTAFAIGACLAPTSMGIALNVLRNAKVLNTPTGQLIIAAAILDDVIALMLLSEMEAMANPTVWKILMPLLVSPAFILLFGFLAIKVTPWLIQQIMMKTNKHQHENVILLLLFVATFTLIPVCFYAGSSHLLGAFLAGLMFCTDHTIHEAWNNQIKRIMQWMLRVFFACTIGFAVPIMDFWSKPVLFGGLLYFVAIIGKILTGVFAKPLCVSEFFTIGFSMSAWGEFAFILATASFQSGTLDKDSYSSVLMAVLLSVIVSPLLLRATLQMVRKQKEAKLSGARDAHFDFDETHAKDTDIHPVYFCVHTKGNARWGHQDKLLHCIFNLHLEIIDFRAFNDAETNFKHHLPTAQDVFYVLDNSLSLPPTKRLNKVDERKLQQRYKTIKRSLKETMADPDAKIDVMRWLPGVRRATDQDAKNGKKKKKGKTVMYCRKSAYEQARLALDNMERTRSQSYLVSGISRIRPAHDALHRDKFTYHGGIHTEQDDLIAMAFIDTLQSLQLSLSPVNRASPSGSDDPLPLNTEELFEKINTLRSCVEQMPIFQAALSDDGRDLISNPPSIQSHDGAHAHARSFEQHYARTFIPLQANTSLDSIPPIKDTEEQPQPGAHTTATQVAITNEGHTNGAKPLRKEVSEHGSILGITHNKPSIASLKLGNVRGAGLPPQPGLFLSQSHGILPHNPHRPAHGSHGSPFGRVDVYPREAGWPHHPTSQTHSSDHNPHISSEDSDSSSADLHCDTMYGDEDQDHRPMFTGLQDLDEEESDEEDEEEKSQHSAEMVKTVSLRGDGKKKAKKRVLKRSTTWSALKLFSKHRKLSGSHTSEEDSDQDEKKKKRQRKRSKDDLSSSSAFPMDEHEDDHGNDVGVKKTTNKSHAMVKSSSSLMDTTLNDNNGNAAEKQPLKGGNEEEAHD